MKAYCFLNESGEDFPKRGFLYIPIIGLIPTEENENILYYKSKKFKEFKKIFREFIKKGSLGDYSEKLISLGEIDVPTPLVSSLHIQSKLFREIESISMTKIKECLEKIIKSESSFLTSLVKQQVGLRDY